MSERKVLNKYIPPDFDPALIPRRKLPKDKQIKVRLITPFSMRCDTCGEYIYKGKKFNAKKELTNEEYLGIQIFRFYIRCNRCSAEITFKTDPKNNDYTTEHGAQMKFEVWNRVSNEEEDEENEEDITPIQTLEERTHESKRELDIAKAIDEIKTLNDRNELLANKDALDDIIKTNQDQILQKKIKEDKEDTILTKTIFSNLQSKRDLDEKKEITLISESLFDVKNSNEGDAQTPRIGTRKRKHELAAKLLGISVNKTK